VAQHLAPGRRVHVRVEVSVPLQRRLRQYSSERQHSCLHQGVLRIASL
jgi:hypothetical protein